MPEGTHPIGHQREGHQRATRDVHGKLISRTTPTRTRTPEFVLLFSAFIAVFLAGCDVGSPDFQPLDAPPLHLVEASFYGVDAAGNAKTITLTPQNPSASTSDLVLTTSSVRLRFDRFLLPGEAIRQSLCLQPLSDDVPTIDKCTQPVFLEPTYDPVHRIATYRLSDDQMPMLLADTRYWLTLLSPTEKSPFGFSAFDGAPLEKNLVLQFTTTKTNPAGPPVDPSLDAAAQRVISEELFCVASACVAVCAANAQACQDKCPVNDTACVAKCDSNGKLCQDKCPVSRGLVLGCGSCHSPIENGGSAMGLDLSSANRISAIFGRVANQTQTGGNADEPDTKPVRFGRAMPQIEPGNPGNSYLLYKMLVSPIYARSTAATGMAAEELDRLRASVVVGLPMPPYDLYAIPEPGVDALTAWISTGAATPACP